MPSLPRLSGRNRAHDAALLLVVLYAGGVLFIMSRAGSPKDVLEWLRLLPFLIWALAPVIFSVAIIRRKTSGTIAVISTALLGLALLHGLYVYDESMFGDGARSTSALVFIFLPLYQWVVPLTILLVVFSHWCLSARNNG